MENKTKDLIRQASRRATRNPSQAAHATAETRVFARELIRARKTTARLVTSKAQLNSVAMQVQEAFAIRKIGTSMQTSAAIMKDVNVLVRLPELMGTMQELNRELIKAGIVEETIDEMMPIGEMDVDEEEEVEGEVDKVLGEILKDKLGAGQTPSTELVAPDVPVEESEEEEDPEEMLAKMRGRLQALKS